MLGFFRNALSTKAGKRKCDEKRRAMLNDIVLDLVFYSLDLESLKKCRLVCYKWANICEPYFIKKATFCYATIKDDRKGQSTFRQMKQRKLPAYNFQCSFESFKFMGIVPLSVLEDLLIQRNYVVKELTITNLTLIDGNCHRIYYTDEYFGRKCFGCIVTDIIAPNIITKLHLDCFDSYYTRLEISLDRIISVQYLVLKMCTVIVNERIAPKEMELWHVLFKFQKGGKIKPCVVLNEFFYFRQIKTLRLESNCIEENGKRVMTILDLKDCNVTVDILQLYITRILDWETANWNINVLVFANEDSPFLHRNSIKAKEIEISIFTKVDLAFLPKTIERLTFGGAHKGNVTCTNPINLPKLRYLYWKGYDLHSTQFINCCNLVDIELHPFEIEKLNLNFLPSSVKRLFLKGKCSFEITGQAAFELEKLILKDYQWDQIESISNKLHAKNLVIFMEDYSRIIFVDNTSFTKFVEKPFVGLTGNKFMYKVIRNLLFKPNYERIAIANSCVWRNYENFNVNTDLYYLLETQKRKGRLIPQIEFEELMSSTLSTI